MDLKWLKLHKHATKVALPAFAKLQLNLYENGIVNGISAGEYSGIVDYLVSGIMVPV